MFDVLDNYNYEFPVELIANAPASPRDSARLLVFNRQTKEKYFNTFNNLDAYLPKNAVLVLNQTKVFPARLELKKPTGGAVRVLYIVQEKNLIKVLADRKLDINTVLFGRAGASFTVVRKVDQFYFLKPSFAISHTPFYFDRFGVTPLPPYIKNTPLKESRIRKEYQAVFAKKRGSVAAPTASLHFTPRLLAKLARRGIKICYVTLHVNMGTFAPVTPAQIDAKKLHHEWYEIDAKTAGELHKAKKENRPIVAVGTTVVRTLESASNARRVLTKLKGETNLFIQSGYKFKFVNSIITNFHVPRSSLLMLVSAFAGQDAIMGLYKQAVEQKFRLFSFGDGMLLL